MKEDYIYLSFCYLILGLTLIILIFRSKYKVKTLVVNTFIVAFYSGLFIYNLMYNSSGGSGLLWLVYLMSAIGVHWIFSFIKIVLTFTRRE